MEVLAVPGLFRADQKVLTEKKKLNLPEEVLHGKLGGALESLRKAATQTAPTLYSPASGGAASANSSPAASKFVDDYIYFIASIAVKGSEEFAKKVDELRQQAAGLDSSSAEQNTAPASSSDEQLSFMLSAAVSSRRELDVQISSQGRILRYSESVSASAEVDFEMDGINIHAEVSISAEFSLEIRDGQVQPQQVQPSDPLALDLNGDRNFSLSRQAVAFDLNGDGRPEPINFASGGDVFVALDRNGNGAIDNGTELFGDQHGAANGFEELAKFDENNDGFIDSADSVYSKLVGACFEQGALKAKSLADLGVARIALSYMQSAEDLGRGNSLAQTGSYVSSDGAIGRAGDLLLAVQGLDAEG